MNLVKKYFSKQDLEAITGSIRSVEQGTAGEVRVEIRQRKHARERAMSVEQIARREFVDLGMMKTRDRTGVLIFLLLEERQFCILADEGIHALVGQDPWTHIAAEMGRSFKEASFVEGVQYAVREVGKILQTHVPRRKDDTNELSDTVGVS